MAQIKVGQHINNIQLVKLLNAPVTESSLTNLNGKVIWLEFWATWCAPCVEAMPALQQLQKTYKSKLQIVAISAEAENRLKQFIINRPSNLWFAVDSADSFGKDFPFHTIPHSILINAQGIVVAITAPENITSKVIADVIAGRPIDLPLKEDKMVDNPWKTFFPAADTVQSLFSVQPKITGMGTAVKQYSNDSVFKNRRISLMNVDLELAYRIAYNDFPYDRTLNQLSKTDSIENKKLYCIDIIVPKGHEDGLKLKLREELKTRFGLQAYFEKHLKPVYILQIADAGKIAQLKKSTGNTESVAAMHGNYSGEDITLSKIADYLEQYGLVKTPVLDGTDNNTKYDIAFTFMPEKTGDLEQSLLNLGLTLKKEDRNIDVLVFR